MHWMRRVLTFGSADLVGITAVTYQVPRAYQVAQACRKAGIPTVMGGSHATMAPDEAARYVDSVVVKEGISVWQGLLKDFEQGKLKKRYNGGLVPLESFKGIIPDRGFLKEKYKYRYSGIITTAGCPYACDFCAVPLIQGRRYRERPAEDVLEEMRSIAGTYRGLVLTDENFYGHGEASHERAQKLFGQMVEEGIYQNWFGFTSLNIYQDDVVLDAMVKSGCCGVLIGIESIDENALSTMKKKVNLKITIEKYRQAVAAIRKHGIAVWGTMVFGNDFESVETFDRVADFVLDSKIDIMTCGVLTPFFQTPLFKRLQAEKRIFRNNYPGDWLYYTSHHLTYHLKGMSLEELIEGFEVLYSRLYATEVLRERFRQSKSDLNNMNSAMFAFRVNLDWQTVFRHLIDNLKDLLDSGLYYRTMEKSSSIVA
jgi:radical SAM superfamily enzyme YgiQ (UPF0313 family)